MGEGGREGGRKGGGSRVDPAGVSARGLRKLKTAV